MAQTDHRQLNSGLELGVAPMPDGQVVSVELRMLTGTADEPAERLGLARLVRETIDKGTARRDGRALLDAFDELGASLGSWVGREATGYTFLCLPEFVDQAVALHAEFFRSPTFPADAVEAALALTFQELAALDDDPPSLADKLIGLQGFGPVVGRYPLGERETLERIGRDDIEAHWHRHYSAGRMQVSVAGPVEPRAMADLFERHFAGFGNGDRGGRDLLGYDFQPARSHHARQIEQEQIALCFPSAAVTDDDFAAERVLLGVLSGGMSARLFTEIREKLGLAYDVHAGHENPRGLGMIFVSASCKPERAQTTFDTLLREIDRLSEDLTEAELERAKTRIVAREETLADMTRSRRGSLAFDLFHHGRPIPIDQRLERIRSVTADDLTRYLQTHPRDRLSIVTVGPEEIGPG